MTKNIQEQLTICIAPNLIRGKKRKKFDMTQLAQLAQFKIEVAKVAKVAKFKKKDMTVLSVLTVYKHETIDTLRLWRRFTTYRQCCKRQ